MFLNIKIPPNPEVKPKNKGSKKWLPIFFEKTPRTWGHSYLGGDSQVARDMGGQGNELGENRHHHAFD